MNPLRWSHKVKLIVAFAALYILWGSTYLGIRIGLEAALPPALFAGIRLFSASLILFAFAKSRGSVLRIPLDEYRIVGTVGLFLLVGGMYFTFLAERSIPSGLAALIVALLPLWTALAESFLPGMERPSARGIVGLVVGFSGLAILMVPRMAGLRGTPEELIGIGIQVIGTWLWTTGSIYSKRNPVKTDALVATAYEMLTAGVILLGIGTVLGEWAHFTLSMKGFWTIAYLSVMGSCVAFTAFVWLLRNAPASKVMTYAYVNPVIAVFLGWLVLREPVDGWVLAGMAVIVAGVALTTSAPTRPAKGAPPAGIDAESIPIEA
ncbi:MAG: EamA family transporter [Actinomycetota bacterium]|nr:MAG: DMT family [Actinomycetota bacterium]MDO8949250.1 EamA family transporter [Actinomycetota bacterium]MDP3629651.1 EamA family transporter [Actinomycetota bacterium]